MDLLEVHMKEEDGQHTRHHYLLVNGRDTKVKGIGMCQKVIK